MGVPISLIKVHNTPDGNFPNGIPNPLLLSVVLIPAKLLLNMAQIWALHLTVILTAVFL